MWRTGFPFHPSSRGRRDTRTAPCYRASPCLSRKLHIRVNARLTNAKSFDYKRKRLPSGARTYATGSMTLRTPHPGGDGTSGIHGAAIEKAKLGGSTCNRLSCCSFGETKMQRSTLRNGALRRSTLCTALALCFVSGAVMAQSNASGVVFGRVAQAEGTTVHLQTLDTGLTRDIAVDSEGRYRASSVPVGRYKVTLERGGQTVETRNDVQVALGGGVDVSVAGAPSTTEAQNLEGVQVTGNALPAIDVSSVDSRTVLTSQQLQKLPLARDVTAAALLAPGVVAGDARYGNVASFGGASASENQYYINGYAVTNALTGLGFTSLPFDAIDQQQIYT